MLMAVSTPWLLVHPPSRRQPTTHDPTPITSSEASLGGTLRGRMALKAFCDGTVFGERLGDGVPGILALHGWGRSRADFAAALGGLDAIALDLPGFGASPPPAESGGARAYAASLSPVLSEMRSPVTLVGHSFGGRVAVCMAATHGDRIGGLVLVGTPLLRISPRRAVPWRFRLVRALRRAGIVSEQRLDRARNRFGSADYRAADGIMRSVLVETVGESYEAELAALSCPVRLLWGEDDTEVSVAVARSAAAMLEERGIDVNLEVVPGAGHQLPTTDPDVLRSALAGVHP
jgi:pimeloyl-ACP methyl ester carboxylesterase